MKGTVFQECWFPLHTAVMPPRHVGTCLDTWWGHTGSHPHIPPSRSIDFEQMRSNACLRLVLIWMLPFWLPCATSPHHHPLPCNPPPLVSHHTSAFVTLLSLGRNQGISTFPAALFDLVQETSPKIVLWCVKKQTRAAQSTSSSLFTVTRQPPYRSYVRQLKREAPWASIHPPHVVLSLRKRTGCSYSSVFPSRHLS